MFANFTKLLTNLIWKTLVSTTELGRGGRGNEKTTPSSLSKVLLGVGAARLGALTALSPKGKWVTHTPVTHV